MDYKSTIEEGLKEALKKRDQIRVSVFRMLLASTKNKEVEKIRPLLDEEFYALVKTSIKQHNDSIESFRKGGRPELVEKEEKELEILKEFQPPQLSEEEILKGIEEAIAAVGATSRKEMGKVIKLLMDKFPGRIDGKMLSTMVLNRLSS
ncbi:MAG: GatB/YqeY domain-containing protein [Syntrophorhabdaceae bacterium]|nr:GatB/YqeY domain-containing protein [Syntrophorhabdaceae bacterium]